MLLKRKPGNEQTWVRGRLQQSVYHPFLFHTYLWDMLNLKVVSVDNIHWGRSLCKRKPNLYVEVYLGSSVRRTSTTEGCLHTWDETLSFPPVDPSEMFSIKVLRRPSTPFRRDVCIGSICIEVETLSGRCTSGTTQLSLDVPVGKNYGKPSLVVQLQNTSVVPKDIESDVNDATQAVRGLRSSTGAHDAIEQGLSHLNKQGDLGKSVWALVQKIDVLASAIDRLSSLHPYVNAAWQLVSALYKAISHQIETDRKLIELASSMEDAFEFVKDVDSLPNKTMTLKRTLEKLLQQTIECCQFILHYTSRNFPARMMQMSRPKIEKFAERFVDLKTALDSNIGLRTAFVSARISEDVEDIYFRELLDPFNMNAFNRNTCLENTRAEVLNQIMGWLLSDTAQNILWLHGVAGSGKSTIATTIAENCRGMSRLGAFIFFRRTEDTECQLVSLFRTIAFRLVMFDSSIAQQVKASVKKNDHITEAVAEVQFTRLLLEPLNAARDDVQGPVVIVIDALDECGTREARRILMSLLKREFGKLPTNYRFFITSRSETDISTALSNHPGSAHELTLDSSSADSKRDVLRYIDYEMRRIIDESDVKVPDDWPWDTYMQRLAQASEGLFLWASTAIKLVSESPSRLRRLYDLVNASHRLKGLDRLYKSVLMSSGVISMDEPYSIARFMQILGLILLSRVPLTDTTIDAILGLSPIEPSRETLVKLQSVLIFRRGEPVRLLHTSFADFLMSSPCSTPCSIHHDPSDCLSGPWFSDVPIQSSFIARRCFTIMKGGLSFNMCDLESSFVYNKDVVGIKDQISSKLPPHLQYACKYWAQHLADAPYSRELLDEIAAFAYERLLYWLEVLGILGQVGPIASRALLDGAKWCETHDPGLSSFLRDASKLAATFAMSITESTPHIYISMLPLMKNESETAAHYSKHASRMVEMNRIGTKPPPLWSKVLEGHTHYVLSVALSPDGKLIASGSWDGTVRIWDFESGEMVCHLFEGHQVAVNSLAFSPDGRLLVTGSWDKKVRIWDIESREVVSGPFEGHAEGVRTVAFARDGKHIASGSGDMTIRVWDVENRTVSRVLKGHKGAVRSVAFSSDKKRIFSASEDKTIRVWNAETGQAIGEPLIGHTKEIYCMAISPNGRYLASGSGDNTVRVWDIESWQLVSGPFEHTDSVYSVCFAPDAKRVVSGSADRTIIVWEVATGEIVSGPFTGHVGTIRSVAFSTDGSCIVSGCQDKTLRIWDASIGKIISDTGSKHSDAVFSVAFSPDGSRVVSGSRDKTVRLWDTSTGEAASAPFARHTGTVYSAVVSPDGRRIASGSTDKTAIVWDIGSGEMVFKPFEGHSDMVTSVAFSTDGTRIVSGSNDRTIIIWNAENGVMIAQSEQVHKTGIRRVAFSPDDTYIASASVDNDVVIWNAGSGELHSGPFKAAQDSTFLYYAPLSFSPDGRRIASRSSSNDIIVRDLENGQIVSGPLKGHTGPVTSVAFSQDGSYIASGSIDRAVIIWDASSGKLVSGPYKGHSGGITCITFSPDSSRVVSCSFDGTIRIWVILRNEGVSVPAEETSDDEATLLSTVESIGEELASWTLADNGWILGPHSELLLWLPPDIRSTLWRPRNAAIFSCEFSTKLNFRNVACGRRWKECFNSNAAE